MNTRKRQQDYQKEADPDLLTRSMEAYERAVRAEEKADAERYLRPILNAAQRRREGTG